MLLLACRFFDALYCSCSCCSAAANPAAPAAPAATAAAAAHDASLAAAAAAALSEGRVWQIRDFIGARGELIAYYTCAMERGTWRELLLANKGLKQVRTAGNHRTIRARSTASPPRPR